MNNIDIEAPNPGCKPTNLTKNVVFILKSYWLSRMMFQEKKKRWWSRNILLTTWWNHIHQVCS